jgi:transcriptional regulator with XRE-family HTH domain
MSKTTHNPLANLGARIAKIREDKRLTQTDLAKKIDTTQSVIARIEKGEQNLSAETLSKIERSSESSDRRVCPGRHAQFPHSRWSKTFRKNQSPNFKKWGCRRHVRFPFK